MQENVSNPREASPKLRSRRGAGSAEHGCKMVRDPDNQDASKKET